MRRLCIMFLALTLIPAYSLAAFELPVMTDNQIDFSNMTIEDLHILRDLIDKEIEDRADESILVKRKGESDSEAIYVWITRNGKKYHATNGCSGMQKPERVTLEDAIKKGKSPCSRCDPPELK